jgi:putative ABC transport system permease protein
MHDVTAIPFNLTNRATAYITPETLKWLGGSPSDNLLAVSVAEHPTDQQHVTEVAQAVANRLERAGAIVNYVSVYQPGHHFAYNITQGIFFVLGVLGYLTVLLSAFLIINTVTALMNQQTR